MHIMATAGIQIAVYAMFGKGSSMLRVPIKIFMGKHCKCMASYTNIWETLYWAYL